MRARAALKEPAHRRRELRPARGGAEKEQLVQRQLTREEVASGQAGDPLDVERRDDLPVQNLGFESRCEALDRVTNRVPKPLAFRAGPAAVRVVRAVLHEVRLTLL